MTDTLPPPAEPPADECVGGRAPSFQQYAELAELAGGFIHEIKNHLGTLSLNLQLLAEDFEEAETQRERRSLVRVNRLRDECQRLTDLSNDFLRFARVQEIHPTPTALDEVVARMIDFLTPTARQRNIELNWFPAPDLPPVNLDRDLFDQALLNLMLNAEQAMPDGGTLTLIGRVERSAECSVPSAESGHSALSTQHSALQRWVCLDVIDTGHGMPPEVLAKLFRPFHTTKANGNGLGLPTVKKVVLAHGGSIDAQSEPGRGTKFSIRLPAAGT